MSDFELHLHDPREREAQAEHERAEEDGDLKWLVSDPRGRRITRRLFERTGVWRSNPPGDALTSAYRDGERNAGLRLMAALLQAAPEATARIITGQDGK